MMAVLLTLLALSKILADEVIFVLLFHYISEEIRRCIAPQTK